MDDPKQRLKKLYALALQGVRGEKEQAQAILDKLLKKYSVSIDELDDETVRECEFEYHGEEQESILLQTSYKVTGRTNNVFSLRYTVTGKPCRTRKIIECTAAQKTEIEFLFDFYKKLWEKEKEALLGAFIQKHRLFGELKNGEKGQELSFEELKKMRNLMSGLSDEKPLMQIEGT